MEWLTIKQVAEKFKININTARQHYKRGKFDGGTMKMGDGPTDIVLIHIDAARRQYGKEKG